MKSNSRLILLMAACCLLIGACSKVKKPQSAVERENWRASLNDSIAAYEKEIESISSRLEDINTQINTLLSEFSHVTNPRAVAGYYILSSWESKYPLASTGIIARINEDEDIEISAALSGGKFTHINLQCGSDSYTSEPVPHDQAFNYVANNLDRVCFSGASADSIAAFIYDNSDQPIKMTFIENSATGNYNIPAPQKEMIATTYRLYSSQKELKSLEKQMSVLAGRIDSCRKMMAETDSISH